MIHSDFTYTATNVHKNKVTAIIYYVCLQSQCLAKESNKHVVKTLFQFTPVFGLV